MKSAIVTGAGGFVGEWLINRLIAHGVNVTAIDLEGSLGLSLLPKTPLITQVACKHDDAANLEKLIANRGYDVFYNLAWVGAGGPMRADYNVQLNNVKMCLDYLESADKLNCNKFVSIGTIGQYMAELSIENNITSENFIYTTAKSFCERMLRIIEKKFACNVIWATLTGLYGPGDTTPNLINYTIKSLLRGESPIYGPALQPFDFIHISDCVEALYKIGNTETKSKSFVIGSGQPRLLKEFLNEIGSIVAPEITLGIGVRPDDNTVYKFEWFDTTALLTETGFRPEYTFTSGIVETTESLTLQGKVD